MWVKTQMGMSHLRSMGPNQNTTAIKYKHNKERTNVFIGTYRFSFLYILPVLTYLVNKVNVESLLKASNKAQDISCVHCTAIVRPDLWPFIANERAMLNGRADWTLIGLQRDSNHLYRRYLQYNISSFQSISENEITQDLEFLILDVEQNKRHFN